MLFPKSTPKKPRRGKENKAPAAASTPQRSPFAGDGDGFSNESMSIIPSSMCLAATAMTSIAQKSVAKAASSKSNGNPGVSAQEPQPSTSAGPPPGSSTDVPMDPFEGVPPPKSKTGKGTKGLPMKGRAKVRETARKTNEFPATFFFVPAISPTGWRARRAQQEGEETAGDDDRSGKGKENPRKHCLRPF